MKTDFSAFVQKSAGEWRLRTSSIGIVGVKRSAFRVQFSRWPCSPRTNTYLLIAVPARSPSSVLRLFLFRVALRFWSDSLTDESAKTGIFNLRPSFLIASKKICRNDGAESGRWAALWPYARLSRSPCFDVRYSGQHRFSESASQTPSYKNR